MTRWILAFLLCFLAAGQAWGQQQALIFHVLQEIERSSRPKPIPVGATLREDSEYYEELPDSLIGELKVTPQVSNRDGGRNIEPGQPGTHAEQGVFRGEVFEGADFDQGDFGGGADQGR